MTEEISKRKISEQFTIFSEDKYISNISYYGELTIRHMIQTCVNSPLYDERLLHSNKDWRNELSKDEIQCIKDNIFKILFNISFDDYAKGVMRNTEKLDMVHSKLKSIYREEMDFVEKLLSKIYG